MACQTESGATPTLGPEQIDLVDIPSKTLPPTETPVPPTSTLVPTSTQTATSAPPTETPPPACINVIYEEYAQFEIITSDGQRILIDVYDPERLLDPVSADDILLTTHTHWDHYNSEFQAAFSGPQLFLQVGSLDFIGGNIQGIASAHNAKDHLQSEGGTNYIYLIETGGLRIAHFGDIGQNKLTDEQLEALGKIDVALTQINNPYSDMDVVNNKGIHLIEQLQPRLVIPTHLNLDTVKSALAKWPGFYSQITNIQICKTDLSNNGTQILLMGEAVETMIDYVELTPWENQ